MIGKNWSLVLRPLSFVLFGKQSNRYPSETKDKGQRTKNENQKGFTMFELMIAMFILIILLSVALPTYQRSVQHARETVLKENLFQMRRAIDQYTADKGKLPESLDKLIEEKYLREKPVDPITEKAEWTEITGDNISADDGTGVTDVKSQAEGEDSDGKQYQEY